MSAADILVIVAAVAALAGLGWFFFGPRKAKTAVLAGGVQRLEVTVKGGYRRDGRVRVRVRNEHDPRHADRRASRGRRLRWRHSW
jgi:plastocyanin domain-containing protein